MPRGKKSKDSLFSLLTEGEAVDLASDFGQIIKEEKFFQTLCQSVEETDKQSVRYVYCSMQNTKWPSLSDAPEEQNVCFVFNRRTPFPTDFTVILLI